MFDLTRQEKANGIAGISSVGASGSLVSTQTVPTCDNKAFHYDALVLQSDLLEHRGAVVSGDCMTLDK